MPLSRGSERRRRPTPGAGASLDNFLLDFIRAHPGCRFQQLITASRDRFGSSRPTTARHLSRLVGLELASSANGSYHCEEASGTEVWLHAESRRFECTVTIDPAGSCRDEESIEFRVRTGFIRRMRFRGAGSALYAEAWSSAPSQLQWISAPDPGRNSPEGDCVYDPVLGPDESRWETFSHAYNQLHWYRMYRGAQPEHTAALPVGRRATEQGGVRFHRAPVSPFPNGERHPWFRYTIVLPLGYPFREAEALVYEREGLPTIDTAEQARIRQLSREDGVHGFRITGSTLSLMLPNPQYLRYYVIRWGLPSRTEYNRWLCRAYALAPSRRG